MGSITDTGSFPTTWFGQECSYVLVISKLNPTLSTSTSSSKSRKLPGDQIAFGWYDQGGNGCPTLSG
ncbi:hypothetical protein DPMN_114731 [Dreissena polymorpha]|uniref:Uncharacterized protein n=1 Tax=Dreissena polymorpha TaxID=45954 RepID=A0A9D4KL63_DREPO|nr:hypothetical protein DPMN_114731 [Dreissena polymorpha]